MKSPKVFVIMEELDCVVVVLWARHDKHFTCLMLWSKNWFLGGFFKRQCIGLMCHELSLKELLNENLEN